MRWTFLLLLAACGGDAATSDPATVEQAQEFCQTGCEYRSQCRELDVADCVERCLPRVDNYRADALEAVLACSLSEPCESSTSEAGCLSRVTVLDEHREFAAACMQKLVPCGAPANYCDLDDDATPWVLYAPVVMDAILACTALVCDEQIQCLEDVEVEYGLDLSAST